MLDSRAYKIDRIEDLQKFAVELSSELVGNSIVLLRGPMASGKSEFVRQILHAQGESLTVASPTFALQLSYDLPRAHVEHWDLYRLQSMDELEGTGFWDQFQILDGTVSNWVFIEWPERLEISQLPRQWSCLELHFHVDAAGARTVTHLRRW